MLGGYLRWTSIPSREVATETGVNPKWALPFKKRNNFHFHYIIGFCSNQQGKFDHTRLKRRVYNATVTSRWLFQETLVLWHPSADGRLELELPKLGSGIFILGEAHGWTKGGFEKSQKLEPTPQKSKVVRDQNKQGLLTLVIWTLYISIASTGWFVLFLRIFALKHWLDI